MMIFTKVGGKILEVECLYYVYIMFVTMRNLDNTDTHFNTTTYKQCHILDANCDILVDYKWHL